MVGQVHGTSFVVQYDEDQWLKYDEAGQDFTFEQWAKRARPLKCTEVVLQLIPDPLFPAGEHTSPYVHDRRPIQAGPGEVLTVTALATVHVDPFTWGEADEKAKIQLREDARRMARKRVGLNSRYIIVVGDQRIEEGRQ